MNTFDIKGPFAIQLQKKHNGRRIEKPDGEFWRDKLEFADKKGCYVFSMGSPQNFIPYYVGKATKSFSQEIFTSHKLDKYNSALSEYRKGRPYIFFIIEPSKKGSPNRKDVDEIEKFLTAFGYIQNPEMKNDKLKGVKKWAIKHVTVKPGSKGRIDRRYTSFRKMMGIYPP